MTLIVTFAASDAPFVVMVADRRLTWPDDGRLADDNANKIVMFCNQMAFAYTGQAEIEGKSTDKWLAGELAKLPNRQLSEACQHITKRATEAFKHYPLHGTFHTFVGIGFVKHSVDLIVRPIVVGISNSDVMSVGLDKPRDEFVLGWKVYNDPGFGISYFGVTTLHKEITWIMRRLKRMAGRGISPTPIIHSFRDLIRMVSTRHNNEWVGKSLLAVVIPKESALSEDVGIF